MNSLTLLGTILAFTTLLLTEHTMASKRKCRATLNSDAYYNSWQPPNLKWKSPKRPTDVIVPATIHGRMNIPTNEGSTIRGHICYATLSVNLTDCSIVLSNDIKPEDGWDLHKSPIYRNHDTWIWNDTIEFREDCPENIHVEVFEP